MSNDNVSKCFVSYPCLYAPEDNKSDCKHFVLSNMGEGECSFFTVEKEVCYCDNSLANYEALKTEIGEFFEAFESIHHYNLDMAKKAVSIALNKVKNK